MKACEDIMLIILHAHVMAASKSVMSSSDQQFEKVEDLAREIVSRHVYFDPDIKITSVDKKYVYGTQVLTLTLLWYAFNDAVHEGDGDHVLRYWKFFAVVFKATRHYNYFKESVILQLQYNFLLSEREAAQLKWSRFVNNKGRKGCNISCDLHLEHLNRRLKQMVHGIHSINAIDRAAQSIGFIHKICSMFEKGTDVMSESDKHSRPAFTKECTLMCNELVEQKIFEDHKETRCHPTFKNIQGLLQQAPSKQLLAYIIKNLKTYQL